MEKGALRRVFDYYADQAWFAVELDRLILQFFEVRNRAELVGLKVDEMGEGLLNEWLLFDAVLSTGNTMLADFSKRNPYRWSTVRMVFYHDIVATHQYGLFEVTAIRLGEGLSLFELHSGRRYDVRERSATYSLKIGNLFYNRVAKVNDHWELVGADGPSYPVQLTQRYREALRDVNAAITPKETYHQIAKREKQREIKDWAPLDPVATQKQLERFLKRHLLAAHVTVETILRWIRTSDELDASFEACSLLFGLTGGRLGKRATEELVRIVGDVCNTTARDSLGGVSPQEKVLQNRNRQPEFISDIRPLGGKVWHEKLDQANVYMGEGKYAKAVHVFQDVFRALYDERTTLPDIYRLYANKAVAHLAARQPDEGKYMIALALSLNPNYDFGQTLRHRHNPDARYEPGSVPEPPTKRIGSDPAAQYFRYLRDRNILFVTKRLTTSKLTTFPILGLR